MTFETATPEFSRPLRIDQIPGRGCRRSVAAAPEECAALAERFGLVAIDSLEAEIETSGVSGRGLVRVKGRLTARVVQSCVVTLEPVSAEIDSRFAVTFGPPAVETADEIELVYDDVDPPDPIEDGQIDLGEVIAEHLALALDPFPRAPGASFVPPADAVEDVAPEPKASPFGVLAALRQKMG